MNSFQNIKDIKLAFIKIISYRNKKFNFKSSNYDFYEFKCKIPIKLNTDFPVFYQRWYNSTVKNNSKIIIDKESDYYTLCTSSNNIKFHKYLIFGILDYIKSNKTILFEEPIKFNKSPIVFERSLEDYNYQQIINWLEIGICYESIINFMKNLKLLNPKAKFLTSTFKNAPSFGFNFDLLDLPNEKLIPKINGFLDQLFMYNEEEDFYTLKEYTLNYTYLKDDRIPVLLQNNKDYKESINFNYDDITWKDYLLSIGNYGINILVNREIINEYADGIEIYLSNQKIEDDKISKKRQFNIKKLYNCYVNQEIQSKDFHIYSSVILNSNDTNNNFLIRRGLFCIKANNLLKSNNTENYLKRVKQFIKNNKTFFTRRQKENDCSGYYIDQLLKEVY